MKKFAIIGRKFEYKVRDYYKNKGYLTVRSAKSGGIGDIVAIPPSSFSQEYPFLIQCKKMHYKKINKSEIRNLLAASSKNKFIPVVAAMDEKGMVLFEGVSAIKERLLGEKNG